MTQYLPQNLLALFAPRDPIPFVPPLDKLPWEKKSQNYTGVANFISDFEDPKDTPPPTRVETKDERKERKRKERAEQIAYKLEQDLALWAPGTDPGSTLDPFKTLFVTRVNYDTSESKLRREFEVFGPVRKIKVCHNQKTGKPRGYAFIEYEHERDMHSSYKHADGKKIDGRRVLVDIERGRTIKGWRPRRLGGGLGGTRKGGPDVNTKYSGREDSMRENRSNSRSRSPRPVRRRRSRSPRERRPRRSRSPAERADRPERPERRRRSRDRDVERGPEEAESEPRDRKRPRRSRSRDRAAPARRSRSPRDRKRSRRSRSKERRRESRRERGDKEEKEPIPEGVVPLEQPPPGGDYMLDPSQIKLERDRGYNDPVAAQPQYNNGDAPDDAAPPPADAPQYGIVSNDPLGGEYQTYPDDQH